jgi:cobalt-zinc-cadmium efflux system protein
MEREGSARSTSPHQPGHQHEGHRAKEHRGHNHGVSADADRRYLTAALALIIAFMTAEVIIGVLAHSLALITDAAHMLTDAAAIAFALIAMRLSARPPTGGYTFGLKRAEIMAAQLNGATLLLLAAYFLYQGIGRLIDPPHVQGDLVLATALAGIAVNLAATWLIGKADRTGLNIEGAYQHILNDLFAFITAAIAGLVVILTGFTRADAIAALIVAALMIKAGYQLVRDSSRVFMEAAPTGLDPSELGTEMATRPGVVEIHDLHIWEVTSGYPALSAHVLVEPGGDCHAVRRDIENLLTQRHHIHHITLQVDHTHPTVLTDGTALTAAHCDDPHGPHYAPAAD